MSVLEEIPYRPDTARQTWTVRLDAEAIGERKSRLYVVKDATPWSAVQSAISAWQERFAIEADEDGEIYGWCIYSVMLEPGALVQEIEPQS